VAGLLRALHRIEPDRRAFLQAREQLVLCNQRLVLQQVRRYQDQGVAAGDLVQEGNLGLVRAAERFDHRLGFRFSTYAIWWIRQALMRAVSEQSGDIRHPYNQFERYGKVHKASRQFVQMHGRDPRPEEIEELSGLDAAQIASTLEAGRAVASLQQPTGEEKDRPLSSFIADTEGESPCAQVERRERLAQLERSLEELPERESRILRLRYGLGHEREHTLDEIGHQFDLTRERIRQLEARALERLRLPHHARLRECLELAG
jgi:RNA polymerase primary sigma factor